MQVVKRTAKERAALKKRMESPVVQTLMDEFLTRQKERNPNIRVVKPEDVEPVDPRWIR